MRESLEKTGILLPIAQITRSGIVLTQERGEGAVACVQHHSLTLTAGVWWRVLLSPRDSIYHPISPADEVSGGTLSNADTSVPGGYGQG